MGLGDQTFCNMVLKDHQKRKKKGGTTMKEMKTRSYYEMSEKQWQEMKKFYETLGYNGSQVKKLTKSCFGSDIKVSAHTAYSENWTFYKRRPAPPLAFGGKKLLKGRAMAVEAGGAYEEDDECFEGAMPLMGMSSMAMKCGAMPEPMLNGGMAQAMMAGAMQNAPQDAEFNTATTQDVSENEIHSPLDNPQLIFSANVNTASWSYLRNMISRNRQINPDFVRIEEIINSYPYQLKKPKEELFAVSAETGKCPWNEEKELLFVGLKGKKADKSVKQNLTFLVDVSGSMEDEWILVQMSMAAIISKLKKGDTMSVIAYSDETTTVVKQIDCGDPDKCVKAILSIDGIGGYTNGSDGLENAYQYLEKNFDPEGNNRVFIFTDGDFNFGLTSVGNLKDFIYEKRKTGIYLSIVGYGEHNFKDDKMEALAQNGNGNYTFVANPNDILDNLWKKLTANLVTVAKDVKILVELNPRYVNEYRLIGYDARILTQQEFHDTKKATDGIGSEHNVVAMIELKRGQAKQRFAGRYVKADTEDNAEEFAFVEVHYKSPEDENLVLTKVITLQDLEEAKDQNMPMATMLATFGLLVKDSACKGNASKEMLAEMLRRFENDKKIDTTEKYSHFDIIRNYVS